MQRVFISYRRGDTAGYARSLSSELKKRFGNDHVFHDINIEPPADFVEVIENALAECHVLIVIVGRDWLEARDKKGRRRLDNPDDFVSLEIQAALKRSIGIIPVLVHGATMPEGDELPSSLQLFARRQAYELSDSRWDYDVGILGDKIAAAFETASDRSNGTGKRKYGTIAIGAAAIAIGLYALVATFPWSPSKGTGAVESEKKVDAKPVEKEAPIIPIGRSGPPITESTVVRIAYAGPLTGSFADLGKAAENGVALAVQHANDKKLTIGGKSVTFKMVSENDQADPMAGTTVAQKLVDAKVAAVVGHLNSRVTIPASEIYNRAGIPVISGSATDPMLTERGLKNTFRTVGRDDHQSQAIASFIAGALDGRNVAILDDKTAFGEAIANEVEKTLKAFNVTIVGRERTTDDETDFKVILMKIWS